MNELGNIRISDDVVKTIAAKAASDVEGVYKLAAIHLPNTNAAEFVRELSEEDILQLIRRSNSINKDKILIMRAKRFLRTSYKSMEKFFLD